MLPLRSQKVDDDVNLIIKNSGTNYVSRSGKKLEAAIRHFKIDTKDKLCLDIGSSTGGFTQYLLENNAKIIYAVDVGSDQMDATLATNPKLKLFENTDIRKFNKPEGIEFDLIVCDISFISIRKIIAKIQELCSPKTIVLLLFKPQFEVGKEHLKKGICRHPDVNSLINDFADSIKEYGFKMEENYLVPLKGKEGNQEYFIHLSICDSISK